MGLCDIVSLVGTGRRVGISVGVVVDGISVGFVVNGSEKWKGVVVLLTSGDDVGCDVVVFLSTGVTVDSILRVVVSARKSSHRENGGRGGGSINVCVHFKPSVASLPVRNKQSCI